tara:strand:+ start:99 stop:1565 length:1467 start_codon:yes stop_codon:yes gene_type:complete
MKKNDLTSRFSRTFKDSSVYAISSILNSAISFLLLPILTFYYDAAEYGIYSIIISIVVIMGGFFYFGASSSYARFVYDNLSKEHKSTVFSQTLNLALFGGLVMISLIIICGDFVSNYLFETSNYHIHFIAASVATVLGFFVAILHVVFQFDKSPRKLLIISFIAIISNFIVTYLLLVYYNYGILAPIIGILISNLIVTIFLLINYFNLYNPLVKMYRFSNFLKFGFHSSISGILFYLIDYSDRLMINQILSADEVGIYSLGYKLGLIINIILVIPFSQAWAPVKMEYLNDIRQYEFTTKIISYYFLLGVIIVFISTLFGTHIFDIFFVNKDFNGYAKVFPIIMSSIFIYGIINISNIGLHKEEKINYQNFIMLIALLINIILNISYLEQYGILLAAFSTLITYSFIALFVTTLSNKYLNVTIEKYRVFSLLILLFLLLVINSFTEFFFYISIIQKMIICILFFLIIYIFWVNIHEKKIIKKLILQKLR